MKTIVTNFFILAFGFASYAQSTTPAWQYIESRQAFDVEHSKAHPSGGVFVAVGDMLGFDAICYLLDASGNYVWWDWYNYGQAEMVVDVETDASGNCYVLINTTALNQVNLGQNIIVRKYSPSGSVIYTTLFNHVDSQFSNENDEAYDLALDKNDNVYVVGKHFHGNCTWAESYTLRFKLDPFGTLQWEHGDVNGTLDATSICFSSLDRLYMPTAVQQAVGPVLVQVREIDVNTGNVIGIGNLTYNGGLDGLRAPKLTPDPFGNMYVLAKFMSGSFANQPTSPYVAKVTPSCQEIWSDTINDSWQINSYQPVDILSDVNGDVFIAYNVPTYFGVCEAMVGKLDSSGQEIWEVALGVSGIHNYNWDLDITSNGDILTAISISTNSQGGSVLYRLSNQNGSVLWSSQQYAYGTMNAPRGCIAIGGGTDVYLTGCADQETYTIKFGNAAVGVNENSESTSLFTLKSSDGVFVLNSAENIQRIEIYSVRGELVSVQTLNSTTATIDLSTVAEGIYFCTATTVSRQTRTFKLLKH